MNAGKGTLLALDLMTSYINYAARLNKLISEAQIEGRDVSIDELKALKAETTKLEQDILNTPNPGK